MKRIILLIIIISSLIVAVQAQQTSVKKRKTADVSASAVTDRKISVRYTDGLKAFYSGNNPEALKIFNGIVLDNPKHDPSFFMLSKIYTGKKSYHDAIDCLQSAIKIDKTNVWYKVELAKLYMKTEDYVNAAKMWESVCKIKDNNEYYLYSLAETYINLGKPEKVIDTYNRMEKLMGQTDELTRVKASIWLYMNKIDEAVKEYDKLIAIAPHTIDYYLKAGNIYQSNGMMPKAIKYYEKAAELNPDEPMLNVIMASYWEQNGQTDKQVQCLSKAFKSQDISINEKISYLKPIINKATKDQSGSLLKTAEELADILRSAHPDNCNVYSIKAALCGMQKNYAEAEINYEKALKLNNTDFSVWEDYCYTIKQLGHEDRLLQFEEDVTTLFPQNAQILTHLGLGYLKQKNADKAINYLKKASAFAYENAMLYNIYQALGDAYQLKGETDKAESFWNKAKQKK